MHIYNVGISATAVKLKVSGQFKIFSKVISQATTFLQCIAGVKLVQGQVKLNSQEYD